MQADTSNRSSFFDDDDPNVQFVFRKQEKFHQKDLETPPTLRNTLIKHITGSNLAPQQASFALHNRLLAVYKNNTAKVPDMVMDLSHSKLKDIMPTGINPSHGFSLTKNGSSYEFYSPEKQVIDDWMAALKYICILSTFHEEYKALKMIGRGSFAKVYLVESKTTGKMFAVKAFTKESVIISNKSNAKPSMLNEIDLMRVLDHDNIIKLYEVYETDKSIYLVLELIQGKSLQDIIKRPTFREEYSETRVMKMIFSILDALAYLASKGIMHRDLKPDNILVDKGDKIKIVDFGLATYIDVPEYIFKKCGTPGYIAPEVFRYDQKLPATNYDHHCDVFSAGCIFFYMLFGYPFFEGSNASEILRLNRKFTSEFDSINAAKKELKDPNSKISKEATKIKQGLNLLLQLIEFDPKKRITALQATAHSYFIPMYSGGSAQSMDMSSMTSSPIKRGSINIEHYGSRPESMASPGGQAKDRFAEKDSLYLDMGKPELNGKVDTLTNGSHNNSLLLHRADSNANMSSREGSMSAFSKNAQQADQKSRSKSFRSHHGGQSFLKAAIFRNMQKNGEAPEESKDERGGSRRDSDQMSGNSRESPTNRRDSYSSSDDDDASDICQENPQVQYNVERIKAGTPDMRPSKNAHLIKRPIGVMPKK